jgi:hypothetical protein
VVGRIDALNSLMKDLLLFARRRSRGLRRSTSGHWCR